MDFRQKCVRCNNQQIYTIKTQLCRNCSWFFNNKAKTENRENKDRELTLEAFLRKYPYVPKVSRLNDDEDEQLNSPTLFIAYDQAMKELKARVTSFAKYNETVLITGERGTGKEVIARTIFEESHRKNKPFIIVNCSSLTDDLAVSELFGHSRGAFTGAYSDYGGLFSAAQGGTIFLDEISNLPIIVQGMMLRVLDLKEVRRAGSTKTKVIDVRVVAASNKDLKDLVNKQLFMPDLYDRLKVLEINVPPLRARKVEIPIFAKLFYESWLLKYPDEDKIILDEAYAEIQFSHNWTGNLRELQSFIKELLITSESPKIGVKEVRELMKLKMDQSESIEGGLPLDYNLSFIELKSNYFKHLKSKFNGNIYEMARFSGISVKTVYNYRNQRLF